MDPGEGVATSGETISREDMASGKAGSSHDDGLVCRDLLIGEEMLLGVAMLSRGDMFAADDELAVVAFVAVDELFATDKLFATVKLFAADDFLEVPQYSAPGPKHQETPLPKLQALPSRTT